MANQDESQSPALNSGQWNTCANPQFGFAFQYPAGWVNVPDIPSIVYHPADARSFIASDGGKTSQVYSPAVTLMMMPRGKTAGQTPAQVYEGFKQLLPSFFKGYAFLDEQPLRLASGHDAVQVRFDFLKAGRPYTAVLAYVVRPTCIFIFDGSGLKSDFASHESTLRQCLQSLCVQ